MVSGGADVSRRFHFFRDKAEAIPATLSSLQ
jgi:hypothetical protein